MSGREKRPVERDECILAILGYKIERRPLIGPEIASSGYFMATCESGMKVGA